MADSQGNSTGQGPLAPAKFAFRKTLKGPDAGAQGYKQQDGLRPDPWPFFNYGIKSF